MSQRGGSRPGSGRPKGVPNKATIERIARAKITEQIAAEIGAPGSATAVAMHKAMEGRRLAKDELEEVVPIIKGVVAHYQRQSMVLDPKTGKPAIRGDLSDFKEWLRLFVDTCFKLADFQSSKFRAVIVSAPSQQQTDPRQIDGNVVLLDRDPVGAGRVYAIAVKGGMKRLAGA